MFKFLLKGNCFLLSSVLKASVLCIGSESGNFYFHFKNLFFVFYAIVLSILAFFSGYFSLYTPTLFLCMACFFFASFYKSAIYFLFKLATCKSNHISSCVSKHEIYCSITVCIYMRSIYF